MTIDGDLGARTVQSFRGRTGPLLGFFDGQNPINWLWDTPGDMLANLRGHMVSLADIVTLGEVNEVAAGSWALLIPGPDYSGQNPNLMDFAGPGAATPYSSGGSNAGPPSYHYPGAGLPPR